MPCERYRDALTDAAAGEAVAEALAAHLDECPACESELAELRRLMAAADDELSALATAEPSAALRARIREAVAEPAPTPAFRWGFAWTATAAAVLALAVFAVWRTSVARGPVSTSVAVNAPPPAPAPRPTASTTPPPAPVAVVSPAAVPAPAGLPFESAHEAISVTQSVSTRRLRPADPEVLVPAGEREALLRYVALVHQQKASSTILLAAGQPSADLRQPEDLHIEPLELVPLDPAEASGT
jgi:hypothetical protein